MGCNCGKARQKFKTMVVPSVPQPATPPILLVPKLRMTRADRARLRTIRIENRNKRIAARNAAILAIEAAKKNLGNQ